MAFHLGSLGFLTPFEFDNFEEQVTNVLEGHAALTLRSRLRCIILRKDEATGKASKAPTSLLVLNEVVIDRGPSPYLSNIDLFLDGKHITSVQGDGKNSKFYIYANPSDVFFCLCRPDCFHSDWLHGLCCGSRSLNDPSKRASYYGYTHLPSFIIF